MPYLIVAELTLAAKLSGAVIAPAHRFGRFMLSATDLAELHRVTDDAPQVLASVGHIQRLIGDAEVFELALDSAAASWLARQLTAFASDVDGEAAHA